MTIPARRAKKALGRPSRLTPAVQRQICKAIASGCYIETAAEVAGVGRSTLYTWLAAADDGEPKYLDFRDAIKGARAKAEARSVAAVLKAGNRTWQAHAWFLERSFPDRWRRRNSYEEVPREIVLQERERAPDAADKISDALHRNPNNIPRALAALEVLASVMREDDPGTD